MAETLSLRTALIFLGSRCSDGASNRYPRPQLLIVLVTSVYHWNLAKPVVCFCFSRWNRVTEILLGFPVESLDQKLTSPSCGFFLNQSQLLRLLSKRVTMFTSEVAGKHQHFAIWNRVYPALND